MKIKLFGLLALGIMFTAPMEAQILRTTVAQGEIEGEPHEGSVLYKAIPYAEPPVGDLRWKAPVPKKPWKGVYKAEDWGGRPFQMEDPNQNGNSIAMSEDCLYLSVQTPARSKDERLPVFVSIHGGAFATGSYSGTMDSFVKDGIIYVSIEYRLGPLGFMAHPEASGESADGISGNYGIYDQICALNWIHDNISAFGGDPENVTICGESAGGISVSILCASPLCKGLFKRAISESGGSFCPVRTATSPQLPVGASATYYKDYEALGLEYQKRLGAKSLKQMRKIPAADIVNKAYDMMFWPVVDGKAITGDIYRLYEEGKYNDVDVLIGYNSDEGSLFIRQMSMDGYLGMTSAFGEAAEKVREAYPATNDVEALYAIQDIFRDSAFGWGTWAWANLQSKTGKGRVYLYYFAQKSQNSLVPGTKGATHVAEMPFIYGGDWGPMTEPEKYMAKVMPEYWKNFVKTGDPNAEGLPYWTVYEPERTTVMEMDNGFHLIPAPNGKQMDFWEELFKTMRW